MSKNYAKRDFKKRTPRKKARHSHGWLWLVTGILIGGFSFSLVFLKRHTPVTEQNTQSQPASEHPASTASHHPAKTTEKSSNADDKASYDFYTMLPNRQVQNTDSTVAAAAPTSAEPSVKPTKPLAEAEQLLLSKTNTALPQASSTMPNAATTTPAAEPVAKTSNVITPETAHKTIANAAKAKSDSSEPMDLTSFKNTTKTTKKPIDDGTRYSLDMGSFDSYEKADMRKAELLLAGFNRIHIETYLKNDTTWHRVLIGHYKTKNEAEQTQNELDNNHFQAQIISSP